MVIILNINTIYISIQHFQTVVENLAEIYDEKIMNKNEFLN